MNRPILLLLPTLDRPEWAGDCLKSYFIHGTGLFDALTLANPQGLIAAFNTVPMELIRQYEIIGLTGDDVRMQTPNWDDLVCEKLSGKTGMLYGRDGIQNEKLGTHPFVTSNVILTLGYVQPPQLEHFFGDNFFMELLKPLDRVTYCPELFNEHLHFTVGKSPKDATYQGAESHWQHDLEAWAKIKDGLPALREKIK